MEPTTLAIAFAVTTQAFNLPIGLLSAMCYVESKYRTHIVNVNDGGSDSIGICQIKLATAKDIGFSGTGQDLLSPHLNIYYAGKYLSKQISRYNGDLEKAIAAYNSGTHFPGKDGKPKNKVYVKKVFTAWISQQR